MHYDCNKMNLIFKSNGKELDLSRKGFKLYAIDGIDAATFEINYFSNSFHDGGTVYNKRIPSRDIHIEFDYVLGNDLDIRQELIRFFNPKHKGTLIVEYGTLKRKIDYEVEKIKAPVENVHFNISVTLDLFCTAPYFNDVDQRQIDIAYWQGGFEFILEIPRDKGIEFGTRNEDLIVNIENSGDIETGVIIEFKALGTVINPSLLNVITREFVKINRTMKAGEIITVDTRINNKKIESKFEGEVTNIFNYIDLDSTFTQLNVGDNYFKYDADSNIDNLEVTIKYNNKYLGV